MQNTLNRFDKAVRGMSTDRTPIWFMRQAGRYLPEYREVRKKLSFDQMLADAEVAAEITLQPIRRFDLDAAVIFADIMTILQGLEIPFNFASGGPRLEFNINDPADLAKLNPDRVGTAAGKYAPFLESIRSVRATLPVSKSVIGFAASPFTLLSYLIEGETSKTHNKTRAFMASQPGKFNSLMHSVAKCTAEYLKLQVNAGVSAVQIFESWGDILSESVYAVTILPHIDAIVQQLVGSIPVILYDKGASLHWRKVAPYVQKHGLVYSVDWRVDIREFGDICVQGNLDPALLEGEPKSVAAASREIIHARGGKPGHIFNLGHGITPEAKLECVEAMVETVKTYQP